MGNQGGHIHIGHAITVGETKSVVAKVRAHPTKSSTCFGCVTRVNQGDFPGLRGALMHLHMVSDIHVKRDVTGMQEIVSKILLDHVTLIATANDKVINPKRAIDFEDMPENRHPTNFHQGLGTHHCFFGQAGTTAACKNDSFQERFQ